MLWNILLSLPRKLGRIYLIINKVKGIKIYFIWTLLSELKRVFWRKVIQFVIYFNVGFEADYDAETIEFDDNEDPGAGLAQQPDGRVTCLKCGKTLSSFSTANRHYRIYHLPNQPSSCPICKKVFKNKMYKADHMRNAHKLSAYAMRNTYKPPTTLDWNINYTNDIYRVYYYLNQNYYSVDRYSKMKRFSIHNIL